MIDDEPEPERVWIDIPDKIGGGFINLWWFPYDDLGDRGKKGRGFWQISGHLFREKPFSPWLETTWSLGRYGGGRTISNLFCWVQFWR